MTILLYFYVCSLSLLALVFIIVAIGETSGRTPIGRAWNSIVREIVISIDENETT